MHSIVSKQQAHCRLSLNASHLLDSFVRGRYFGITGFYVWEWQSTSETDCCRPFGGLVLENEAAVKTQILHSMLWHTMLTLCRDSHDCQARSFVEAHGESSLFPPHLTTTSRVTN